MRACAAFLATAFLLTSLTTAANAYADLPNCAEHATHTNSAGHDEASTDTTITAFSDDTCCDCCSSYIDSHFDGLSLATAPAPTCVTRSYVSTPSIHALNFASRPHLPPPKSAPAHRQS